MAPPYGLVAMCTCMLLDCTTFATCALAPAVLVEDGGNNGRHARCLIRILEATSLARLCVLAILSVPSVGARCCAKRSVLVAWIWANTCAVFVCVATATWITIVSATDARPAHLFLALCISSLLSCRLLASIVDYIRADVSPVLDVYLNLASLWKQPSQQDEESLVLTTPSSVALNQFAKRSSSIRSFWRDRLTLVHKLARDLVVTRARDGLLEEEEEQEEIRSREDLFGLLLRLFAHEEDALEPISEAFERDPTSVVRRALQLTGFALFGAYPDGPRLRNWLLGLCRDIRFAHRVQWYLDAFVAAGVRLTPSATAAVCALSQEVRTATRVETFEETPRLVETLTEISRDLKHVNRASRNDVLRERLHDLDWNALPCGYVPLLLSSRIRGRVLRIHQAECKVFSTKDRCPYLVCLEVERTGRPKEASERKTDDDEDERRRLRSGGGRSFHENELLSTLPPEYLQEPLGQWRGESPSPRRRARSYGSLVTEDDEECRRFEEEEPSPPTVVFTERWKEKQERILGDRFCEAALVPVIVKARDDLRQEQFASQLMAEAAVILKSAKLPVWMRPYEVLATGPDSGIIEAIPDTVSLDALKRNDANYVSLLDFFQHFFVDDVSAAQKAFVASLAPACILSYILQLKDRHNGNILIDRQGHLIHIDFGYMLSSSPGGNMGFEAAPFKLTAEFLDVIGRDSRSLRRFRELCYQTFLALRRQSHRLVLLAEMTVYGSEHLPCFDGRPRETIDALKARFKPSLTSRQLRTFVDGLIDQSINNWRTSLYDQYQRRCVGIF